MFKKILEFKLSFIARCILRRYKPMIIGVTGNAGKTTTKEAIASVVSRIYTVRVNGGNLNNELGLPMTIIGDWSHEYHEKGGNFWLWLRVLVYGWKIFIFKTGYPDVLVLEYGADHPGDIKELVKKYKPNISVVTSVGDIPVHVEYFGNKENVAKEKAELVRILSQGDHAILNQDDELVRQMKNITKAKAHTFGFSEGSDFRVTNYAYSYDDHDKIFGISFKINEGSSFLPVKIDGSLGESSALASVAACAVGRILEMNLVQISDSLLNFHGQPGRLKLINGIKDTQIIDDTYNASPAATKLALNVLKEITASRKIAVIGDMLELGEYTEKAHEEVGALASNVCDILICVGARSKFTYDEAEKHMNSGRILHFNNSQEAKLKVQEIINVGDVILVKGSQGMRMEKIVGEIMLEPEKKKLLLVRQSKKWLAK